MRPLRGVGDLRLDAVRWCVCAAGVVRVLVRGGRFERAAMRRLRSVHDSASIFGELVVGVVLDAEDHQDVAHVDVGGIQVGDGFFVERVQVDYMGRIKLVASKLAS